MLYEHSLFIHEVKVLVSQPCPALCNPMDCSLPGSSVHKIHQARILEWVAISHVCLQKTFIFIHAEDVQTLF